MKKILCGLALLVLSVPLLAQNRTSFNGVRNAFDFAYGNPGVIAGPLRVDIGNTTTGSASVTLVNGQITLPDSTVIMPLSTSAPVTIGIGPNAETVTPTAVSCGTPAIYQTCSFTASFANLHGTGDLVSSGSFGLDEAINDAHGRGGAVALTGAWGFLASTNSASTISAAPTFSNVFIEDNRGLVGTDYSVQPSTLTLLAAPAVLTSSTVASGTATGTWTAADTFFCVTYVDELGGEGPCSPTYDVTLTASVAVNFTATAAPASTGAVGWRAYAGASYALAYLLPITSANCTLTTLESVVNACAIGQAAVFPTANTTTTQLKPAPATPLAAANNIVPQGHTTFAYQPTGVNPIAFQTNYGPFPAVSGGSTAGQVVVLGTAQLPTGYLNTIGRTIRISGKAIVATAATSTTPSILVKLGWAGGDTAGVGVAVCTITTTSAMGVAGTYNYPFSCVLTTNAAAATSVGSLQPDGFMSFAIQGGTTAAVSAVDTGTAAIGSLGLQLQDTVYVYFAGATSTTSSLQLMDLHIETIQ